jgi:hypothetical protein
LDLPGEAKFFRLAEEWNFDDPLDIGREGLVADLLVKSGCPSCHGSLHLSWRA